MNMIEEVLTGIPYLLFQQTGMSGYHRGVKNYQEKGERRNSDTDYLCLSTTAKCRLSGSSHGMGQLI